MLIRPCAELCADFPDDMIEEDGEVVQFGGRGVAEAIAAILRARGYEVSTPEHQQENGWDFDVKTERRRVWFQISDLGDVFVLTSRCYAGFLPRRKDTDVHAEVLTRLAAGLAADRRFKTVRWQLQREVLSGAAGSDKPVSA